MESKFKEGDERFYLHNHGATPVIVTEEPYRKDNGNMYCKIKYKHSGYEFETFQAYVYTKQELIKMIEEL